MKNREILFRAWDGETFYYIDLNKDISDITAEYLQMFFKLPKEQYISLDCLGKPVYEGDYVQCGDGFIYEIRYSDSHLSIMLYCTDNRHRDSWKWSPFDKEAFTGYRVIGNIYQGITEANNE